jgi:uncharacterized protein (TIGR03790 family)
MTRLALPVVLLLAAPAAALDPRDIVIVVNSAVPASREVADHYVAKRKVPAGNVVSLRLPVTEDISRAEYDSKLVEPLRRALADRKESVRCLLTVYGVPLRVGERAPTDVEKAEAAKLVAQIRDAEEAKDAATVNRLKVREAVLLHRESTAAVDSELMLLWWPAYPLARMRPNPLYWQFPPAERAKLPRTLLTARLDGPTPAIARRLVDDAIAAEESGLVGNAYVDARGIKFTASDSDPGTGYGGYDESFREAADLLKKSGLPTTLDDADPLFPANACPNAAIYCGWYALTNYRPVGNLVPGAVAWHLASGEATTLRDSKSKAWCPNLLTAGAAVTLGPVAEPYTVGFPKPAEFFGYLLTGEYPLAEVYARTQVFTSWMTVLVGDPLYTPFGKTPRLKLTDVPVSPKGGRRIYK